MRLLPAVLALVLFEPIVAAHPTGGSGGNGGSGGRLGGVSGGLRGTNRPSVNSAGGGTNGIIYAPRVVVVEGGASVVPSAPKPPDGGPAQIEAYFGASKIHESDGMWNAELGIRDGLFRLGASLTRYYETQRDGSQLTLTMPSLIGGMRIDDRGPTRVYLELGFVNAKTRNDPVMDTSVTGGIGGVRLEHRLTRNATLVGTVHQMIFEQDVRARSATIGIRFNVLQASFRVLDFNVGPALYGPELGLRF